MGVLSRRHGRMLDVAKPASEATGKHLDATGEKIMSVAGMNCEACGAESKVVDTRKSSVNNAIHRRRKCRACARRWATIEMPADVIKYIFKEDKKLFALVSEM